MDFFKDFNRKKFLIYLAIFIALSSVYSNFLSPKVIAKKQFLLGTEVEIRVITRNKAKADGVISLAFERMREVEQVANYFDPRSELSQVNYQAAFAETAISDDLYLIIKAAIAGSKQSGGMFDITATPIIKSFRNKSKQKLSSVASYQDISIKRVSENNYLQFKTINTELDLGGVAKGYAVDQASAVLKEHKIRNALVSCGSSMYALGKNGRHDWKVGIKDPNNNEDVSEVVTLKNQGLSTSGDYEQFYYLDNKRISHIVNPRKGLIATVGKGFSSVTVIAETATSADILSTAAFVMGESASESLVTDSVRLIFLPH